MKDLTVGALASRTGITVRTLHHYDAIGLLSPSGRSEAGYRLYSDTDVRRLEHIVLLRGLGLNLTDIGAALERSADDLLALFERHSAEMRARIENEQKILSKIDHLTERIRAQRPQDVDDALETISMVQLLERYFDKQQLEDMRAHADSLGEDYIRRVEEEWPRLIAAVRHEMSEGTPASDSRMLPLARRWQELTNEFVNGRWDIAVRARQMMRDEPSVRRRAGLDAAIMDYVAEAMGALSLADSAALETRQ